MMRAAPRALQGRVASLASTGVDDAPRFGETAGVPARETRARGI